MKRKKGRAKFYARQTMERRTGFQCTSLPSPLRTAVHAQAFPVHGVSSHWREGPWDIVMSEVTRSRVMPPIPERGHQIQSEATRSRGHKIESEATRSRARPPGPERGHQIQSEATRSRVRLECATMAEAVCRDFSSSPKPILLSLAFDVGCLKLVSLIHLWLFLVNGPRACCAGVRTVSK